MVCLLTAHCDVTVLSETAILFQGMQLLVPIQYMMCIVERRCKVTLVLRMLIS